MSLPLSAPLMAPRQETDEVLHQEVRTGSGSRSEREGR